MDKLRVDEDTPIESRMVSRSLEAAQKKVEGFNFDARKNVVQYDDVMNRHRKAVYALRSEVLKADDISARVKKFISEEAIMLAAHPESMTEQFEDILTEAFPFEPKALDKIFDSEPDKFLSVLSSETLMLYERQEKAFGTDIMRKVERDIYMQILDNFWMQHLENMDHLREGIHWISVGQRDPLVEYRKQGQRLFEEMQVSLRHDIVRTIMHAQPISEEEASRTVETELTRAARGSVDNAGEIVRAETFEEADFAVEREEQAKMARQKVERKKARKAERQRKKKAKRRK